MPANLRNKYTKNGWLQTVTHTVTPWSRVLEKLIVSQLVEKFPLFYGNQKFNYCIDNSLPLVAVLSQINPVHAHPCCFFKVDFSIFLPPLPRTGW